MRKYIYIGLGGFFGAMLRIVFKSIDLHNINGLFPINTLLINVFGSFLLAIFLTICIEVLEIDPDIRLGVATGFIGAFTTFSTVCKEVVIIFEQGHYFLAITYTLISVFLGIAAVYIGTIIAREFIPKSVNRYKTSAIKDELK